MTISLAPTVRVVERPHDRRVRLPSDVLRLVVSMVAVLLDDLAFRRYRGVGQLLSLATAAAVEAVAFRPLCAAWRVAAFWQHFRRDLSWGHMERQGLGAAAGRAADPTPTDEGMGGRDPARSA